MTAPVNPLLPVPSILPRFTSGSHNLLGLEEPTSEAVGGVQALLPAATLASPSPLPPDQFAATVGQAIAHRSNPPLLSPP